jgi:DNA-binding NarL/FixJ family response regulator
VICVDDHDVLIAGLRAHFATRPGVVCVAALPDAGGVMDALEATPADVLLMDIDMPGPDVFEIADRVRRLHPQTRVVFLSAHVRSALVSAAYKCGAWGYFAKSDDLDEITEGLVRVASSRGGAFVMGAHVRERCGGAKRSTSAHAGRDTGSAGTPTDGGAQDRDGAPVSPIDALSPRELEVLRLIGKGLSRGEIAGELCRSAKTIDGHQERMMRKLGITTRSALMRFAIREGLSEL